MQISNYSWRIRKREINQCLELLPDKYKNLDVKVIIFGNKIHEIIYNFFTDRYTTKGSAGDFSSYHNTIRCFSHRMYKDKYFKISVLNILLHELRHKIQSTYPSEKYKSENKNYIQLGNNGYEEQWIEIDANRFARRLMNFNMEKINKILGFNLKWEVSNKRREEVKDVSDKYEVRLDSGESVYTNNWFKFVKLRMTNKILYYRVNKF